MYDHILWCLTWTLIYFIWKYSNFLEKEEIWGRVWIKNTFIYKKLENIINIPVCHRWTKLSTAAKLNIIAIGTLPNFQKSQPNDIIIWTNMSSIEYKKPEPAIFNSRCTRSKKHQHIFQQMATIAWVFSPWTLYIANGQKWTSNS